jgi:hypothetical protein
LQILREDSPRQSADDGIEFGDVAFRTSIRQLTGIGALDVNTWKTLFQVFCKLGVDFDSKETGVCTATFEDRLGDRAGSRADFGDRPGALPVDLF